LKSDPTSVVTAPPINQGSVLGRIVAGDTRLAQLLRWIVFHAALTVPIAEVRAELAALKAAQPKKFVFTVGADKGYCVCALCQIKDQQKEHSKPSLLERCWQMCERVAFLKRHIPQIESRFEREKDSMGAKEREDWEFYISDGKLSIKVAYSSFQAHAASIDAYQKALQVGRSEADAILAGEVARSKSIGSYTQGLFSEVKEGSGRARAVSCDKSWYQTQISRFHF